MFNVIPHNNGTRTLEEELGRPIVYLDNWALNDISQDAVLLSKFIEIMNNKKGTLRLSINNVIELMKQSDRGQIKDINYLINSVDSGFINTNALEVIERENAYMRGLMSENPSCEYRLIHSYLMANNWPRLWKISDVIQTILDTSSITDMNHIWNEFVDKMKIIINAARADDKYLSKSKAQSRTTISTGKQHDRPTRELVDLGFNFVIQNKTMVMTSNEWHDLFHSIVPVSYCNIVLLDKRWLTFVNQTKYKYPDIAYVYDKNSTDSFYEQMMSFNINGNN